MIDHMIDYNMLFKIYLVVCSSACSLALLVGLISLVRQSRLAERLQISRREAKKNSSQLEKHLVTILKTQDQFREKLSHMEEKLTDWNQRCNRLEARESQYASYHHAAKLVELGASEDDVAKTCGLSRAEADLVALVNRHQTQKTKQTTQPSFDETKQDNSAAS